MKKNKFTPKGTSQNKLYLDGVLDDFKGLTLFLSEENSEEITVVNFETYTSYRNSNESERYKFIKDNIGEVIEDVLYVTDDSSYLDWIFEQSQNVLEKNGLLHYLVITPEDIFEILSYDEPEISKGKKSNKFHVSLEEE